MKSNSTLKYRSYGISPSKIGFSMRYRISGYTYIYIHVYIIIHIYIYKVSLEWKAKSPENPSCYRQIMGFPCILTSSDSGRHNWETQRGQAHHGEDHRWKEPAQEHLENFQVFQVPAVLLGARSIVELGTAWKGKVTFGSLCLRRENLSGQRRGRRSIAKSFHWPNHSLHIGLK